MVFLLLTIQRAALAAIGAPPALAFPSTACITVPNSATVAALSFLLL